MIIINERISTLYSSENVLPQVYRVVAIAEYYIRARREASFRMSIRNLDVTLPILFAASVRNGGV